MFVEITFCSAGSFQTFVCLIYWNWWQKESRRNNVEIWTSNLLVPIYILFSSRHLTICVKYWLVLTCSWNQVLFSVINVSCGPVPVHCFLERRIRQWQETCLWPFLTKALTANMNLDFSCPAAMVLRWESRWLPKCWRGSITPDNNSMLNEANRRSTRLKSLRPGALVAINRASMLCLAKWWMATSMTY